MHGFLFDLKYAVRSLLRAKGFAAVAVLTVALGIGASTAIWTVVYGVLLRPLPYPEPERLVQAWQVFKQGGRGNFSEPNFEDVRAENRSFSYLARYASGTRSVSGGAEPVRVRVAAVSPDFFRVLGVEPVLGRSFVDDEEREGGAPAVIVGHGYWQRYLGANRDFSTFRLTFGARVHAVVGVLPAGFGFPAGTEIWTPSTAFPPVPSRTAHNWSVVGRLKEGIPLGEARAEMTAIAARLASAYGEDTWMRDAALVPLQEQISGKTRPALLILLGAVGFLLLVACANVVNLLLTRATKRSTELAARSALGASRMRLVQQLLTESLVLSLAGGALGVFLAGAGVRILLALEPGNLPRTSEIETSGPVLGFALGLSVLTAAALGLVTAFRATSLPIQEALRESSRTQAGGARTQRLRSGLVVAQIAVTLVLVVGAGLLARSFWRLLSTDPGFRRESSVVMDVSQASPADGSERWRLVRFYDDLLARLAATPGLDAVGGVHQFPLSGSFANGMFVIVRAGESIGTENFVRWAKEPGRTGDAEFRIASEGYFRAMGIPLVRGRLFDVRDAPDAPHAALVSESLAKKQWPGEDALGKRVQFGNMDGDESIFTIVGVVGDVRERGLDAEPRPTFYGYYRQRPRQTTSFSIVMHGSVAPAALIASARSIVRDLDPTVPPRFRTLDEVFFASLADRRFSLLLLGVFAVSALALAVLGVYGVVSFAVAARTREVGIRIALGAKPMDVRRMVLGEGLPLLGIGLTLGVTGAFLLARFLESQVYGVSTTDPTTFLVATSVLACVALAACYVPARRATRVEPVVALRSE